MIELNNYLEPELLCDGCEGSDSVQSIIVRRAGIRQDVAIEIHLCKKCRGFLRDKLEEELGKRLWLPIRKRAQISPASFEYKEFIVTGEQVLKLVEENERLKKERKELLDDYNVLDCDGGYN